MQLPDLRAIYRTGLDSVGHTRPPRPSSPVTCSLTAMLRDYCLSYIVFGSKYNLWKMAVMSNLKTTTFQELQHDHWFVKLASSLRGSWESREPEMNTFDHFEVDRLKTRHSNLHHQSVHVCNVTSAGINRDLLERLQLPVPDQEKSCYSLVLAERLIRVMSQAAQPGNAQTKTKAIRNRCKLSSALTHLYLLTCTQTVKCV